MRRAQVAATLAALATAGVAAPGTDEPTPLRGDRLGNATGLRLLVADDPPFVLDVDSGRVSRVSGLRRIGSGVVSVVGVAGRSAVVVSDAALDADFYAVRGRGTDATYLGKGRKVAPAAGGRSVWIARVVNRGHCGLRLVALVGREVGGNRSFPCASDFAPAGSLGVVVNRIRIVDPRTSRTVLRTRWGVLAVAGRMLVLAGPEREFTLLDAATGVERRYPWPSILGERHDRAAVDPRGRYVALEFGDPAWQGSGAQVSDVWLLDVRSGSLTELPGMPAFVSLKRTSLAWTADGRLVLLGETEGRDIVAVWRPGHPRPALKQVRLPERSGGSDSFAVLR